MTVFDPQSHERHPEFDQALELLQRLTADMEMVSRGPVGDQLPDDAPLLENWSVTSRPQICLTGRSTGHPILAGTERRIITSNLWLMSTDRRWARTLSRWYRLGTPADDGNDRDGCH